VRRPLIGGAFVGVVLVGVDYLAHALFAVPLLPEVLGDLLLRVIPLGVFELLLRTLGILARPLLLLGSTLAVVAAFAAAGLLLERWLGFEPLSSMVSDDSRRTFLRNIFYAAAGLAVLGIGYVTVRRFGTALAMREGARPVTELTPISDFYVVSKNLSGDPVIDSRGWRLILPEGSLTYGQLLALPSKQVEVTLECISNDVGGTLISNGIWSGPRVRDVLQGTPIPPAARWLLIESADGYTESFPLSELTDDHILATHLDGAPLPSQHGFPARFIFPNHYGMKQPKWVTRLRLSATDEPGYWENNGWNEQAIVKTMSRIDLPLDGAVASAGDVLFRGIAFAGARRINRVELSVDSGRHWQSAVLQPEFSPYSWRFWSLTRRLSAGHYTVSVRATDGSGSLQSSNRTDTLPDGADGYHTISLDVR
jgi:DMSO/TMAO reductase YedYZ molybdopterin-dependent catalytic subunit